jgi:hypothetical protein
VRNWGSKFLLRFVHRIFVNTRGGLPVPFAVCRSASFFEKQAKQLYGLGEMEAEVLELYG